MIATAASLLWTASAHAEFSIFYYQDGRRLNNIADAEALIASTSAVATQQSQSINIRESNTTGNFVDDASIVPLSNQSNYAVYAVGSVVLDQAGDYSFNVFSDDGFSLTINGDVVSSFSRPRAPRSSIQSEIFLDAGRHTVEVVYFERTGRAALEVSHAFGNFSQFTSNAFGLTVASAPEPSQWSLMILGFMGVASRMKHAKKNAPASDLQRTQTISEVVA